MGNKRQRLERMKMERERENKIKWENSRESTHRINGTEYAFNFLCV